MKAIVWFFAILIVSISCDESELDESEIGTGPHKKRISSIKSSSPYDTDYRVDHFQYTGKMVSEVRTVSYERLDPTTEHQVSDIVVKYKFSNGVLHE